MNSITKSAISNEMIQKITAREFPFSGFQKAEELTEGYFNAAYLVTLENGQEMILKIAPPEGVEILGYEKDIMKAEVEAMKLVKARTDIPLPEVTGFDYSHSICPSDYFFMTKLEGKSFSSISETLTKDEKDLIEKKTGEYNRKLNAITGEGFGYYGSIDKEKDWFGVFSFFLEDIFHDADRIGLDIGINFATVNTLLTEHRKYFQEVTLPRLVHWDLWPGNVFVSGNEITGFIDFERCLWGDELLEYGFRSHIQNPSFLSGYGKPGFTEGEKIRIIWYDLYLFLIMSLESDYRKYPDRGLYFWAKEQIEKTFARLKE